MAKRPKARVMEMLVQALRRTMSGSRFKSSMLSNAPMVILRAGSTAGLSWEVERCARSVMPRRLVVLVPLTRSGYKEFRRKVQGFFPCRLPEYNGRYIGATTLRAVLYFEDDWTPHMDPVLTKGYISHFLDKATEEGDVFTREKSTCERSSKMCSSPF